MEALARFERGDLALALSPLGYPSLRLRQVVLGAIHLAPSLDDRQLGLAQGAHRPIVAILRLPVFGVREALGADGVRELPHPALTRRQLLLGVLRILHEALGASGAFLQRGGLER